MKSLPNMLKLFVIRSFIWISVLLFVSIVYVISNILLLKSRSFLRYTSNVRFIKSSIQRVMCVLVEMIFSFKLDAKCCILKNLSFMRDLRSQVWMSCPIKASVINSNNSFVGSGMLFQVYRFSKAVSGWSAMYAVIWAGLSSTDFL